MVELGLAYVDISDQTAEWLKDLRVRYLYSSLRWCNVQPRDPNNYVWTNYDVEFEKERTLGISSVRAITHTPAWASRNVEGYDYWRSPPCSLKEWELFIKELVIRYPGRTWTIWAEPDNYPPRDSPSFVCFTGTADDYAEMLRSAYIIAKKHDPSCSVGLGGLVGATLNGSYPYPIFEGHPEDRLVFLERLVELKCMRYCDFVGMDCYAYRYGGVKNVRNGISRIRKITRRKPLWVLETGCKILPMDNSVSNDRFGHEAVTQETHAGFLLFMYKLCEEFDVSRMYWLTLQCSSWGLVNRLGRRHLAYEMFRLLQNQRIVMQN